MDDGVKRFREWRVGNAVFPQDKPDGKAGLARAGGMELWDYYAAHPPAVALNAYSNEQAAKQLAEWAFDYADAMMEERKRRLG